MKAMLNPMERTRMSRRQALTLGGAAIVAAGIPTGNASAAAAAGVPPSAASPILPVSPEIAGRLRQVREEYATANEAYRATSDAGPIEMLRLRAQHKFGYALGLQARNEEERIQFREAGTLLGQLEAEFPDVPMSAVMRARYAKLRSWAEDGGQYAQLIARRASAWQDEQARELVAPVQRRGHDHLCVGSRAGIGTRRKPSKKSVSYLCASNSVTSSFQCPPVASSEKFMEAVKA